MSSMCDLIERESFSTDSYTYLYWQTQVENLEKYVSSASTSNLNIQVLTFWPRRVTTI